MMSTADAIAWLKSRGSARVRNEMDTRYGIRPAKAFGVPVGVIQQLAKKIGKDHALAASLWKTGWYEARMLAAFIDEPARVTPAQMDRWTRDFDNWGICDTACFHLFDRTPHAFAKINKWSTQRGEFVKRTAFALLACVALHDKDAPDAPFTKSLVLIERAATDERNFVRKGVSWALRSVGRRNAKLRALSIATATRLAESDSPPARTTGKESLRDLSKTSTKRKRNATAHA